MKTIETVVCIENSSNGQPVWIDTQSSLFWIEHNSQQLYQYRPSTDELIQCDIDEPILSLSPSVKNGFIATLKDGIGFFDMEQKKVIYISKPEPFNSQYGSTGGVADPAGNYWSITSDVSNTNRPNHVYQLTPNMTLQRMASKNLECATQPAFSPDGRTMYHSARTGRYVYATSLDESGNPIETISFCRISKSEGQPHGLCTDSEGNIWICQAGGGCISAYNAEGERIEKITLNTLNVMYCTFGGENLDTLFISTNSQKPSLPIYHKSSSSGGIYSFKPGVKGIKAAIFSG